MDKRLLYYDYDAALRHYEDRLLKIKQEKSAKNRCEASAAACRAEGDRLW